MKTLLPWNQRRWKTCMFWIKRRWKRVKCHMYSRWKPSRCFSRQGVEKVSDRRQNGKVQPFQRLLHSPRFSTPFLSSSGARENPPPTESTSAKSIGHTGQSRWKFGFFFIIIFFFIITIIIIIIILIIECSKLKGVVNVATRQARDFSVKDAKFNRARVDGGSNYDSLNNLKTNEGVENVTPKCVRGRWKPLLPGKP